MTLWQTTLLLVGVILGAALGVPGWKKKTGIGTLLVTVSGLIWGQIDKEGGLQKLDQAFVALNQSNAISFLLLGVVGGVLLFQVGGAIIVGVGTYMDHRDTPNSKALATEYARHFLADGLIGYNGWRAKRDANVTIGESSNSTSDFIEVIMERLAWLFSNRHQDREQAKRDCMQIGGVLLRLVFEAKKNHREYRLVVFERRGNKLEPIAWAGPADAPHAGALDYNVSFLGAVMREGRSDIWTDGKANGKPYENRRRRASYKCFYAQPLPCDQGEKWGGFTIDYAQKKPRVFSDARKVAIRAFARYVQMIYTPTQKEVGHEETTGQQPG